MLPNRRREEATLFSPPISQRRPFHRKRCVWKACLKSIVLFALLFGGQVGSLRGETGEAAWLRYARLDKAASDNYRSLPAVVVALGDSELLTSARDEWIRGVQGMLERTPRIEHNVPKEPAVLLGTLASLRAALSSLQIPSGISGDGFWLSRQRIHDLDFIIVAGADDRGILYGTFALLSKISQQRNIARIDEVQQPSAPVRWVNQWDNLSGTIERGYAGPSIFFDSGNVRTDLTRAGEYARLLASVGINGCTINNVNADPKIIQSDFIPQIARIADAFRPWGVQLGIAVDVSGPKIIGGLDTFDPLDPRVAEWWKRTFDEIYREIPDFGGVVVKADSEGRLGPSAYGRTPADAANVIARAIEPHGGLVFYRAFVYDHHLDWRHLKNDRAKAAYDTFHPLDGKFDENVVIQIKYGPIDFQVREPVSPLLGGLERTNEAIELQVTQEYTGQQRHLCFLVPMWRESLDFDMGVNGADTPVKDLVSGKTFHRRMGGFVAVTNVGMDLDWLGHPLAMANLYGFGRLAWDSDLTSEKIAEEWTRLTFGNDPVVVKTITGMLLASWKIYESYTGPLGVGTLTDILGSHYGPGPGSSERNGWGQWHRADRNGIGMDRTVATGTGYIAQYPVNVEALYESLQTTPDELLLFFHHVAYTYVLHSGKTVIQHVYDLHYDGAERAQHLMEDWKSLAGRVDDERYSAVLARLEYQAGHAIVWRDAICDWFYSTSGIPDAKGRVGHHPGRIEAEAMQLRGYEPFDVTPPEAASGGKAIECPPAQRECFATFQFSGAAGLYELDVEYFDQENGESRFRVSIDEQLVDQWTASDHLPGTRPNADTSTRRRITPLTLRPGDRVQIEGLPDHGERAAIDYVEIRPTSAQR